MKSRLLESLPILASIAVGIIPVFVLIEYFGVPRKLIIGWGVLSYIIGVTVIKMPLYHLVVVRILHDKLSNLWLSISQGVVSAVSELGAALLFFIFILPDPNLAELIGFGTAAGAVEAIMLPFIRNPFKGTPLGEHSSEVFRRSALSPIIPWMAVVERILALIPHITTRGLVYISFLTGNIIPGLLAVMTFASIDGHAYFAHLEKWPFDDMKILGRLYWNLALIGLIQVVCFIAFYMYLM